jgi:hypothetical protein
MIVELQGDVICTCEFHRRHGRTCDFGEGDFLEIGTAIAWLETDAFTFLFEVGECFFFTGRKWFSTLEVIPGKYFNMLPQLFRMDWLVSGGILPAGCNRKEYDQDDAEPFHVFHICTQGN